MHLVTLNTGTYHVVDLHRTVTYVVAANSPRVAVQLVQNDQWQEALDPAGVTPVELLCAAPVN
jgi:hypothetical protein